MGADRRQEGASLQADERLPVGRHQWGRWSRGGGAIRAALVRQHRRGVARTGVTHAAGGRDPRERQPGVNPGDQLDAESLLEAAAQRDSGTSRESARQSGTRTGCILEPRAPVPVGVMKPRLLIALVLMVVLGGLLAAQSMPAPVVPPLPSDALFDDTVVHDIFITVNSRDWQALKDNYLDNTYYPANFRWRDQIFRNVGIRSRGHTSRSPVKPSLRVDFNRYITDGEFLGLTSLVLRNNAQDGSGLHERVSMLLFNRMGAPYEREAHARLYINNEFSGLYSLVEEADGKLAQRVFGESAGNVYEYKYDPGDPPHFLEDL